MRYGIKCVKGEFNGHVAKEIWGLSCRKAVQDRRLPQVLNIASNLGWRSSVTPGDIPGSLILLQRGLFIYVVLLQPTYLLDRDAIGFKESLPIELYFV